MSDAVTGHSTDPVPPSAMAVPSLPVAPARIYSLQWRLVGVVVGMLILVWGIVTVATYAHTRHEVGELLDAHLVQTANLLAAQPVDEIGEHELEGHDRTPRHGQGSRPHGRYPVPVVFQVWKHGELVARSAFAPAQDLRTGAADEDGFALVHAGHVRWRVYTTPGREHEVQITVAEDIAARKAIVLASVQSLQQALLIALPLVALLIWWSLRRALRPLHQAGELIHARSPQSHAPLVLGATPREIQPLVEALNQLFVRVGDMLQSERRFTADAAHELRTPIAAIRMMAQVAQGSTSVQERDQALRGVLQGCDRATRLVEQLLQLARLEADAHAASTTTASLAAADGAGSSGNPPADVMPALEQVRQELTQTMAAPQQQQVQWQASSRLDARMSPALAAVLLRNLLDNALRYSPSGATVRVHLEQLPANGMRWVVEDSGPGMQAQDMAQLGQRFFRVLGTGVSGSGLGWSIVQRIARLYALKLHIDRSPLLGGLRVTVQT